MKQTTLTQRLAAALVALCMVLSVCAPVLAEEPEIGSAAVISYQKDGEEKQALSAGNINALLPGYTMTVVGDVITITMRSTAHTCELEGVTLSGNGSNTRDLVLYTAGTNWVTDTSSSSKTGLTITGMKNVTVTPAEGSNIGFLGSLKIVDCTGDVDIQNSSHGAVVGRLEVNNSAGSGNVTIKENYDRITNFGTYLPYGMTITSNGAVKIENENGCAVCGSLEIKESASVDIKGTGTSEQAAITGSATISSNGAVRIENQMSNDLKVGAAVGYLDDPNITGTILEVKKSASVEVIGAGVNPTLGGWAFIKSSGDVSITNSLGGSAVGKGLIVTTDGAVTVKGDDAAAIKGKATITAGRNVSIQNERGIAVEGDLIVNSSTGVTVVGNTQKNAVRSDANITSSGAVNISNSQGIAVGGKLTVNNASGTGGDVTVAGKGGNTVGSGAKITSRGAVNITNTDNTGLAVSGDLTVHSSGSVKVSGGSADMPAVSGAATLTSTGKMELSNPKGQVLSGKLTVENSIGDVIVTGSKGGDHALVQGGTSIDTTGSVKITNSSGQAVAGGLNVSKSSSITVSSSDNLRSAIGGRSTINSSGKIELQNTSGPVADNTLTIESSSAVDITGNGSAAALNETEITSDGAVNIISNGGPASSAKLTVNKSGGVTVTAVNSNYNIFGGVPSFADTPKVVLRNNGTNGHVGVVNYTPPAGKGYTYYTSSASNAAKQHTHDKDIVTDAAYLRIEPDTIYTLTLPQDVTAKTDGTSDIRFYADEMVTVTAPADTETRTFENWSFSGTVPTGLPDGWQNSREFTFKMPADNVMLEASYHTITKYKVTVTGGTIVDGSEPGKAAGSFEPGDKVTIRFTESTEIENQFKQWTGGENITDADPDWQNRATFTFTMPDSAVSLTAVCREVYDLSEDTGKAEFFVDGQKVNRALAGNRVTVKLLDGFLNDHREFDGWQLDSSTALVNPEDGWQNKPSFSFTMPEGSVVLLAYTTVLYDLTVNGGTIVDERADTVSGIYRPGTEITVRFNGSADADKPFKQWTYTGMAPAEPDGGWTAANDNTSETFTFKMPYGNVTLEAQRDQLYMVSIHDSLGSVTINGEARSSLWAKEGETVTVATTLKDGYWMEFEQWTAQDGSTALEEPSENWQTSTEFSFKMPVGAVELTASWKSGTIARPDPDAPAPDPGFAVEPQDAAPAEKADTAGAALVAAAVGSAAVWGGYEAATRVILHKLLPEGAAIPKNQAQLALLLWNTAGQPEPSSAPAFAGVDDATAKAAQWCTEQGYLSGEFKPEKRVTKYRVIDCWHKAFPAA